MIQSMLCVGRNLGFRCMTLPVYKNEFPKNVDEFDGFLITGSRGSVYVEEDWLENLMQLVRELNSQTRKIVGICFGHQLIAQALGGRVTRASEGWGVGVQAYEIESSDHQLDIEKKTVSLPCCHQNQVVVLPPRAIRFLANDFCENAGFVVGDHIFAIQPHPEFSVNYLECILRSIEDKILDRIDRALTSLRNETDNAVIARLIAGFLRDEFSGVNLEAAAIR